MSRKRKYNKYDLSGEYGVGYASNSGAPFYFDLEDYDLIKGYCWNEHILCNGYHALEAWDSSKNNVIRMQWIIIGKWCDHIDRNPLNNRKSNLRIVTQRENVFNRGKQKTNKSGVIGVYWLRGRNKWRATIRKDGKSIYLKDFENFEDAVRVRLKNELALFGEFAPQTHLFEQYGIRGGR